MVVLISCQAADCRFNLKVARQLHPLCSLLFMSFASKTSKAKTDEMLLSIVVSFSPFG